RELLAGLEHSGIARLLDGGVTDDGLPFYVMEFVDGEPIDVYCDRRALGVEPRVALVRRVCAAVAHAHGRLVVHRDIKPSNVLVAADGTTKLVDFGIAQALDAATRDDLARDDPARAGETPGTGRLLTPAYASPEQIRGEPPTVASDVYSLGALLYRLLAGRPPHGDARHWSDLAWAATASDAA